MNKNYISTVGMSHSDWLKARQNGIGGSDAPALVLRMMSTNGIVPPTSTHRRSANPMRLHRLPAESGVFSNHSLPISSARRPV